MIRLFALPLFVAALSGCSHGSHTPASTCKITSEAEIASLFERWNQSLKSGDAQQVADQYAAYSILLPTLSNLPRLSRAQKIEYFEHFLRYQPQGTINQRQIHLGCNSAVDAGLYTFTYANGKQVRARYSYSYAWNGSRWLITSHHSSVMPEG